MIDAPALWFIIGAGLGGLVCVVWRLRREAPLRIEAEVLRARLATLEAGGALHAAELERTRERLQAAFGELARETLRQSNEAFLQLARERLGGQQNEAVLALREREAAIDALVKPIRESLEKSEAQIKSLERDRIEAFATIKSQMETIAASQGLLSRETRNLVTALRRPDVRGQWGEMTLRRVVELAGMTHHVDFTEQAHVGTEAGAIRPDMIVHMPERRDIVVDVKTPLDAYLSAAETDDDEERRTQLRRHAQLVGARVRELAAKRYWSQFERSPDFVVLFLPGDQFLSAALQENPGLIDEALRQNVMLATPTSLAALLKAVAYGWKQSVLADNAAEVRRLGEDLYKRFTVFAEHLGKLGKALGAGVESFNKAVGSLEQQILPAARRFPELGLRINKDLPEIEPVASLARTPRGAAADDDDPQSP